MPTLFEQNLDAQATPNIQFNAMAGQSPGTTNATIWFFTPLNLGTQQLRPYVFNFDPNLVDEMAKSRHDMQKTLAPNGLGTTETVAKAIVPDSEGVPIDTRTMSSQWTFVLMIDRVPSSTDQVSLPTYLTRLIAGGFVIDEPINPATGTLNENAMLVFTKSNMTKVDEIYRGGVKSTMTSSMHHYDVVTEMMQQTVPQGTDLLIGSAENLAGGALMSGDGTYMNVQPVDAYVGNFKAGESAKLLRSGFRMPMIYMGDIGRAIDAGVTGANIGLNAARSEEDAAFGFENALDKAKTGFIENSHAVGYPTTNRFMHGFDASKPISIGGLKILFPNLTPVFKNTPYDVPWDVTPQNYSHPRNQMSSLIASAISVILPAVGLANIRFRYNSIAGMNQFGLGNPNGVWEIFSYSPLLAFSPAEEKANVQQFQRYFEYEVTPVIRSVCGEFDVTVVADLINDIRVDLNLFNYEQVAPSSDPAWYTTSGKLGGYTDPVLCPTNIYMSNAVALNNLLDGVLPRKLGPEICTDKRPLLSSVPIGMEPTAASVPQFVGSTSPSPGLTVRPDYDHLL